VLDVETAAASPIATVVLRRGKVNALDEAMVEALHETFRALERDGAVEAVVLTGHGSFFSFGFDIPALLAYSQDAFRRYLAKFTGLYTYLYLFPKPIVASLNGHTIAGGCMLALACDFRLMARGRAKISLNEITFGSSVFAGSVEMLRALVGQRRAEAVLLGGALYPAEEALDLGLVDEISPPEELGARALALARGYAEKDGAAFRGLKALLRRPVAERMVEREERSIREFTELWYSAATRERLKGITIRP
jgi:enoyl-CoA hydratase/carnithine racemase